MPYKDKAASRLYHQNWREKNRGRQRAANIKSKYGVSVAEYAAMFLKQGGHCALCSNTKTLCIDHDHANGRFRGILCQLHNAGLGALGDTEASIEKALNYLRDSYGH